jgi:hypothetical protein
MRSRLVLWLIVLTGIGLPLTAEAGGRPGVIRRAAATVGGALVERGVARVKAGQAMRIERGWLHSPRMHAAAQLRASARGSMAGAITSLQASKPALAGTDTRAAASLARRATRLELTERLGVPGWRSAYATEVRANRKADRQVVRGLRRATLGMRLLQFADRGR